ncbi:hypothetical protein [Micromonospora okii]|uniref:hypothetical protein n=1 Tax=Micromonospora okii TaxID=1182970 RepID=UPI001E5A7221|nr:hypothetical protein [Micromonospora okii]
MTSNRTSPFPAREQHQRHRLVPRETLAADYEKEYGSAAVADYALAVRDLVEQCPEIGPVDTWSRLAQRICRGRAARDRKNWRKRLSRHFTTESKGPPWQTVELVVKHTVPEPDRAATLRRLGLLYEAARLEKPPSHADGTTGDGGTTEGGVGNRPGAVDDALYRRARQRIAALERELAATRAEADRLRAQLRAPGRQAGQGPSRHRPLGEGPLPKDMPRQRDSSAHGGPPRVGRNPGRFAAAPASRMPRLDQVWLDPGTRAPTYRLDARTHLPGGVPRA